MVRKLYFKGEFYFSILFVYFKVQWGTAYAGPDLDPLAPYSSQGETFWRCSRCMWYKHKNSFHEVAQFHDLRMCAQCVNVDPDWLGIQIQKKFDEIEKRK